MREDTNTMELEVENASFLLDKLGQDCEPLQFLRELTTNGIQAIQADGDQQHDEVIWDLDWTSFDADGLTKLCCIDTGVGMSGDELRRYINRLAASGRVQALDRNFGVGAKVAAASGNPHGIVYLSWKDGTGSMIQLHRDRESGRWGLKQFPLGGGRFGHCITLDDAVKPDALRGHDSGTMVVLLGDSADANTMRPPAGVENRDKWIAGYLNRRYFTFPAGIEVKVREQWDAPRPDRQRGFLRQVHGQEHYLRCNSVASGSTPIAGATVRWWILDERHEERAKDATWASTGHRAALYQDEIYELVGPARGGYQRVQEFGVRFAYARVVLYVEPDANPERVGIKIDRGELRLDNLPLPWKKWADEFAAKMPAAIQTLEEEIAAGAERDDHRGSIRERLRPLRHLFQLSRYRSADAGSKTLGPQDTGGKPEQRKGQRSGNADPGGDGGTAGNVYALFTAPEGPRGETVGADTWPEHTWVSVEHDPPTRVTPHLEDRAALYDPRANRIEINEDFRVFRDTTERWVKQFSTVPGAESVVRAAVREWYAQTLVETVLGAQALRGSRHWSEADIDALLSEEALTAAVQPRYLIEERLKRDLRSQLGAREAA